jgi:hypothetical protein
MRWLAILLVPLVAACVTKMGKDGQTRTTVDAKYLVKSDVDRIADANRAEVVAGLLLIADKLYKRNPKEWKKGGAVSREAAVDRLRQRNSRTWPSSADCASVRRRRWPSATRTRATAWRR